MIQAAFPKEMNLASFVLLPLSFLLDFHDIEKPLLLFGAELGFLPLGFQLSDTFILWPVAALDSQKWDPLYNSSIP